MGKLKNYYQPEIERGMQSCSGYNEWCEWLAATRNPYPELDAYLTETFRRRLANAVYETNRKRGNQEPEPFGMEYHLFELERALEGIVVFLKSNKL
jgi:hypothetical protein